MGDNNVPEPHPSLAEAERRVRTAIDAARSAGQAPTLAIRHAELGMILAAQTRYPAAVGEYRTSLGYIDLLRADGSHEQDRMLRLTSLATPPPGSSDIDLDRLEVEVKVALVEALAAGGDLAQANQELQRARPLTGSFFRRRLRRRLDRVGVLIAASPHHAGPSDLPEVRRHLSKVTDPAQERGLRLRLANGYLDAGDYDAAVRESLLLVRAADQADDPVRRAGARQVLGLALEGQGHEADALPVLSDAFRDLHNHGDAAGMIGMAEALAYRLLRAGDATGAATVLRTTQQAAADSGDNVAELSSATMLGVVLDESGDRQAAVEVLTDAASRAETYGRPMARADALHSTAVTLGHSLLAADLVEALSLLDEAKRIYRDYGSPERIAGCDHEAAALLARHGSYQAALGRYTAALQAYEQLPPDLRDTGSWPDEIMDCQRNLESLSSDRPTAGADLFRSGGHTMSHQRA